MSINNLKNQIANIINLPPLPSATLEVLKISDNPHISVQTLSKAIAKDQTLVSKVIKIANSPFFAYPRTISTIDFAITFLGIETVKEIVFSLSFIGLFKSYNHPAFNTMSFWKHVTASSIICRELAKAIDYPSIQESFVAGLIHDIGTFVMSQFFQNEFKILLDEIEKGRTDILSLEEEIYGANHAVIGSWLLEKWNFPEQLVKAVQFHHNPTDTPPDHQILSTLIYYTEYLTVVCEVGAYNMEQSIHCDFKHLSTLELSSDDLEDIFHEHQEAIEKELEHMTALY
jgi:HD-like signal output (HDOD) protein